MRSWIVIAALVVGVAGGADAGGRRGRATVVRPAKATPARTAGKLANKTRSSHSRLTDKLSRRSKKRARKRATDRRATSRSQKTRARARRTKAARAKRLRSRQSNSLVATNHDAMTRRVQMIGNAKREILLSTYIFSSDSASRRVIDQLVMAARRGVSVRIIVDGLPKNLAPDDLARLQRAGVEIGKYNPITWRTLLRPWRLHRRMHDKLLIVDGARLLVGGRNTGQHYLRNRGKLTKSDLDLRVDGAPALAARHYFRRLWESKLVATPSSGKRWALVDGRHTTSAKRIRFVHDEPGSLAKKVPEGGNNSTSAIAKLIDRAEGEVVIRTPYAIPTRRMWRALEDAVDRGVSVKIYTNSFKTRDGLISQLGYEASFRRLARLGVEIHEYQGETNGARVARHDKAVVVDRRRVFVGSHNLDPRSEAINKETGVVVRSRGVARRILRYTQRSARRDVVVAKDGKVLHTNKRRGCGTVCRLVSATASPLLRFTGLMSLL